LGSLDVRDVEAFDALGELGQADGLLQFLLNLSRVGLQHAEALIVGLLGVVAGEIDQGALVSALWDQDVYARGASAPVLFGEKVFEFFAVLEVDGHVEIPRNVRLADVELLEQGGEKFAGMKCISILRLIR